MKFRLGILIGGAIGYYLGAKAGRERYLELNRWLRDLKGKASSSSEASAAAAKATSPMGSTATTPASPSSVITGEVTQHTYVGTPTEEAVTPGSFGTMP